MNSGVFKVIILGILLVVLAFVVGSQAAESSKSAMAILAGLGGVFLLIVMGRRAWWLIFILPPLLAPFWQGSLSKLSCQDVLASAVLVYWIVMWGMGYVKLTWHRHIWLDLCVIAFMGYLAISYFRHPAMINFLLDETDVGKDFAIGGRIYFNAIPAFLCYITISLIPCTQEDMHKMLKVTFLAMFGAAFFSIALGLVGFRGVVEESITSSRFSLFSEFGKLTFNAFICYWPLVSIFCSPWRLLLLLLAAACVMLSGSRTMMGTCPAVVVFMCAARRQLLFVALLSAVSLGAVYLASSEGLLVKLPMGIQRAFYVLPGVKIQKHIATEAQHSSDWRFEMWKWAMDPRAGYIHDYVWGDGFGDSLQGMRRDFTNMARGRIAEGDQEFFAARGLWHNGLITSINTVGYVGLAVILLVFITGIAMFWRLCTAILGTSWGFYVIFFCIKILYDFIAFLIAGGPGNVCQALPVLALMKAATELARQRGLLKPLFSRSRYVPLTIREHEEAVAKGTVPALSAGR